MGWRQVPPQISPPNLCYRNPSVTSGRLYYESRRRSCHCHMTGLVVILTSWPIVITASCQVSIKIPAVLTAEHEPGWRVCYLRDRSWSVEQHDLTSWRVFCPIHTLKMQISSLMDRLTPSLPRHDAPSLQVEAPAPTPAKLPVGQGMVRGSWIACASGKFPGYHRNARLVDYQSSTIHQEESHV